MTRAIFCGGWRLRPRRRLRRASPETQGIRSWWAITQRRRRRLRRRRRRRRRPRSPRRQTSSENESLRISRAITRATTSTRRRARRCWRSVRCAGPRRVARRWRTSARRSIRTRPGRLIACRRRCRILAPIRRARRTRRGRVQESQGGGDRRAGQGDRGAARAQLAVREPSRAGEDGHPRGGDGTSVAPVGRRVARMAKRLVAQWVGALRSRGDARGELRAPASAAAPPPPSASKPSKPKPLYDAAYIASRRNEPELRATRGAAGSIPKAGEGGATRGARARPPPKEKKPKPSPTTPAAPKSHKKTTATYQPHHPGTPLGKGRKLCQECNGVVGSPTRVCPHCNATLPFKQSGSATSPKGGAAAKAKANAGKTQGGQGGQGQGQGGQGQGQGGAVPSSSTVAAFLSRHQERFASCKVSQLKRAVGEVSAGVKAAVDAGRIADPTAAKHLAEFAKKIADVRLLQGVVERPRARRRSSRTSKRR